MRIDVDLTLCEGHGQCLMAAPDVFDLPDDADHVVVLDQDPPEQRARCGGAGRGHVPGPGADGR